MLDLDSVLPIYPWFPPFSPKYEKLSILQTNDNEPVFNFPRHLQCTGLAPGTTEYVIHLKSVLSIYSPCCLNSFWLGNTMTTMTSWALCWAVIGLCILQAKLTQGQGKYIPLATEKEPKSIKEGSGTKISQQQLFELWSNAPDAKDNKLTKDKTFVLGSQVNFIKL